MPAAIPVISPDEEFAVALAGVLLVHTPPETVLLSVMVCVAHTVAGPVMAVGIGFTVTTTVEYAVPQPGTDAV